MITTPLRSAAVFATIVIALLLTTARPAPAQYTFTKVADNNGTFSGLTFSGFSNVAPSINSSGTAAFYATQTGGSGIFTGNGVTAATVAATGGSTASLSFAGGIAGALNIICAPHTTIAFVAIHADHATLALSATVTAAAA